MPRAELALPTPGDGGWSGSSIALSLMFSALMGRSEQIRSRLEQKFGFVFIFLFIQFRIEGLVGLVDMKIMQNQDYDFI